MRAGGEPTTTQMTHLRLPFPCPHDMHTIDLLKFVIISLRNNMFELADRLVGIYKTQNATKSVTINPKALQQQLDRAYTTASRSGQVGASKARTEAA